MSREDGPVDAAGPGTPSDLLYADAVEVEESYQPNNAVRAASDAFGGRLDDLWSKEPVAERREPGPFREPGFFSVTGAE